jgi:hypothetical protein
MGIEIVQAYVACAALLHGQRLQRDHQVRAGAFAGRAPDLDRRPQQPRPDHQPLPRRWPQAALPHHRLEARQDRRPREGGVGRVRSRTARRASRSSTTWTARSATSSRPTGSRSGDTIVASRNADIKPGNSLTLRFIPPGTTIHNVELKKGKGAQLVRSAGSRRSSWPRTATGRRCACRAARSARCTSTAARPSARCRTPSTPTSSSARPGRSRWLGKRPHNRGVTMNPVDHPMGGGEGRTPAVVTRARRGVSSPRA